MDAKRDAQAVVLTKATARAAERLGLSQAELAVLLGVSASSVSRMFAGEWLLPRGPGKEWQLAALFIRVFRSLDALVGGNPEHARAWMRAPNRHLNGVPLQLCLDVAGLSRVAEYLDAMRGAY